MSIEEATEILNNAVITEPSIKSYTYISAEEINLAIQKLMIELEEKQQEIKKLKKILKSQSLHHLNQMWRSRMQERRKVRY